MAFEIIPVFDSSPPYRMEKRFAGRTLNTYAKDAVIPHPSILINYAHNKSFKRETFITNPKVRVYSDSGGLQQVTLDRKIDPIELMRWNEANVDTAFILDSIPVAKEELESFSMNMTFQTKFDQRLFENCAVKTKQNAEAMLRARDRTKLFAIIQGHTDRQIRQWWKIIRLAGEFDGYCFKMNHDIRSIVPALAFIHEELGPKIPIHFLGVGYPYRSIPVSYASSRGLLRSVTADTTSHVNGQKYRTWINPLTFTHQTLVDSPKDGQFKWDLPAFPCPCPVCSAVNSAMPSSKDAMFGVALSTHNFYQIRKQIEHFRALSSNRPLLHDTIKKFYPKDEPELVRVLNAIDLLREDGLEASTAYLNDGLPVEAYF